MACAALAFSVAGCRSDELASTNIDDGAKVQATSLSGSFTMTDDTTSTMRDVLGELFPGVVDLGRVDIAKDGSANLTISAVPPWGFSHAPKTLPRFISSPATLVSLGSDQVISLGTIPDAGKLFELGGAAASDGLSLRITMDPRDIVAAYVPVGHGKSDYDEVPGFWLPLMVQFPEGFGNVLDCNCDSPSGAICDEICTEVRKKLGTCDATVGESIVRMPLMVGFVPNAARPANATNWTPTFRIGAGDTPGKNFHFADMMDVRATAGGAFVRYAAAIDDFDPSACDDKDLCVSGSIHDCNIAEGTACNYINCSDTLAQEAALTIAHAIESGFDGALQPQLDKFFDYAGDFFTPSSPPHLLSPPCSLASCDEGLIKNVLLPASATYQKWDWFLGPFNGLGPRGESNVRITGVFPSPASSTRYLSSVHRTVRLANIRIDYNADPDGDSVPADADICPDAYDPQQIDSDGDGYGDACDPCPCSASEQALNSDGLCNSCDATGGGPSTNGGGAFCASYCQEHAADNCTGVPNPMQDNCNEEAERALGLPPRGDACDPTPCADAAADQEPLQATFAPYCPPRGDVITPSNCNVGVGTRIRWRGVVNDATATHAGQAVFGHCVCNGPHATITDRLQNCQSLAGVPNCIDAQAGAFPTNPVVHSNWQPMTTTYRAGGTFGSGPAHVATGANHRYTTQYRLTGSLVQDQSWRFDLDLGTFGLTAPASVTRWQDLVPLDVQLAGVTWAFTPTYEGATLTGSTADLASHYFDQRLLPEGTLAASLLLPINSCQLGGCGSPTPTIPQWLGVDPRGQILLATDRWTRPAPDGMFGPDVTSMLRDVGTTYTLVTAAEPARRLELQQQTFHAALLDKQTGAFVAPVGFLDGQVFAGSIGIGIGGVGGRAGLATAATPASAGHDAGASAMSGLHQEVYTVYESADGAEMLDRVTIADGQTDARAIGGIDPPGEPLAATYDFDRDVIFVLDEVGTGWHQRLRIVAVARNATGRVLAEVPRIGVYDEYFLSMDYTGDVVLSASPRWAVQRALVAVLAPDDDGDMQVLSWGFAPNAGKLLGAPDTANAGTWSFERQDRHGKVVVDEIQPAQLHPMHERMRHCMAHVF